jgi:hypothetical protein
MGYAKYSEDIWEQIEINREKLVPVTFIPKIHDIIHTIKCLYCDEELDTNKALFAHYRRSHNKHNSIMKLNERILETGEHIEAAIESLKFYPVVNIESLIVNGERFDAIIQDGYIDIRSLQKNEFDTLSIEVDDKKWIIHRSNLITIDPKVEDIIDGLNRSVIKRERPNLNELNNQINAYHLDIRDKQYIDGFFEYYLACLMDGSDKDRLYFGAYNKLLPFIEKNSRARLIIKIICLRYLWIDRLAELCRVSKPNEFSIVCDFFSGFSRPNSNEDNANSDKIFEVFVEEDEYQNTQAIISFMRQEYNAVKRYLGDALKQLDNDKINPNLADKIYLLQAKMSEITGEIEKAQYYFRKIKSPSINEEMRKINNENT